MRIAVLDRGRPFAPGRRGGAHAERLVRELRAHGHDATAIRVPFRGAPARTIVDQVLAVRLLTIDEVDRVIGLGFPAYFARHHDRVVWALREPAALAERLPNTALGRDVRRALGAAEAGYLREARRIHARSAAAADALRGRVGLEAAVLHVPLLDPERFRCDGYDGAIVALGPLDAGGGPRLALRALARAGAPARLVIAGPPRRTADVAALAALARELGVGARVELIARPVVGEERVRLLSGARAVLSLDGDPDGPLTQQALRSRKAVIARVVAPDRPPALVSDRSSGRLAHDEAALAAAFAELAGDAALAERWGAAGHHLLESAGIGWERVVAELTR